MTATPQTGGGDEGGRGGDSGEGEGGQGDGGSGTGGGGDDEGGGAGGGAGGGTIPANWRASSYLSALRAPYLQSALQGALPWHLPLPRGRVSWVTKE